MDTMKTLKATIEEMSTSLVTLSDERNTLQQDLLHAEETIKELNARLTREEQLFSKLYRRTALADRVEFWNSTRSLAPQQYFPFVERTKRPMV